METRDEGKGEDCVTAETHRNAVTPQFLLGSPLPFLHQGPVLWKTIVPRMEGGGIVWG